MSDIYCKHCKSNKFVKNGFMSGKQRYKCKDCRKTFIVGDDREKYTDEQRLKVISMYLEGIGIRSIERLEGISNPLIIKWIRKFAKLIKFQLRKAANKINVKNNIKEDVDIVEIDEIVTWVKKNQKKIKKQGNLSKENIFLFGLLQIGDQSKLLILK